MSADLLDVAERVWPVLLFLVLIQVVLVVSLAVAARVAVVWTLG